MDGVDAPGAFPAEGRVRSRSVTGPINRGRLVPKVIGQVETRVIMKVRWTAPCDPRDRNVADLLAPRRPSVQAVRALTPGNEGLRARSSLIAAEAPLSFCLLSPFVLNVLAYELHSAVIERPTQSRQKGMDIDPDGEHHPVSTRVP
jgi:hypothetical protein